MRIDAAKNHIDAKAWADTQAGRVRFRIGWQRYTAESAEAVELANQLIDAVEALQDSSGVSDSEQRAAIPPPEERERR